MITLGMTSVTFRGRSCEEIIALAKEAGLAGIEWGGDVHVPPEKLDHAKQIGEKTRAAGLTVTSYGSYYNLAHEGAQFDAVSKAAQALGTGMIRIWAGKKGSAEGGDPPFEVLVSRLREAGEIAAGRGQAVALEFHKGTYSDTWQSARRLLEEAALPNLKTYWQPIGSPALECESIRRLGDLLANVHVFHWNDAGKRFALKKGLEQWRAYAQEIRQLAGDRCAILEFVRHDSRRALLNDAQTLRALFE